MRGAIIAWLVSPGGSLGQPRVCPRLTPRVLVVQDSLRCWRGRMGVEPTGEARHPAHRF